MVQLKYFGDDRDYFKYDLITAIITSTSLRHYVFVPMLTEHRDDNEGNKLPKAFGGKRTDLLHFIGRCQYKSLSHWKRWLAPHVESYRTVEPVDKTVFSNETRPNYWPKFHSLVKQANTLVFLDPDTGLQLGRKTKIRKQDWPKYILDEDLVSLVGKLHPSSVLLVYQHLPRNMHTHRETLETKITMAQKLCGVKVSAYREGDLAFVAISKRQQIQNEIDHVFSEYHEASNHRHKSLHCGN